MAGIGGIRDPLLTGGRRATGSSMTTNSARLRSNEPTSNPLNRGRLILVYVVWVVGAIAWGWPATQFAWGLRPLMPIPYGIVGVYLGYLFYSVLIQSPIAWVYYQRTRVRLQAGHSSLPGLLVVFGIYLGALLVETAIFLGAFFRGSTGSTFMAFFIVSSVYFPTVLAVTLLRERFRGNQGSSIPPVETSTSDTDVTSGDDVAPQEVDTGGREDVKAVTDRRRSLSFWVVTGLISLIVVVSLLSGQLAGGIALSSLLLTMYQLWLDRF